MPTLIRARPGPPTPLVLHSQHHWTCSRRLPPCKSLMFERPVVLRDRERRECPSTQWLSVPESRRRWECNVPSGTVRSQPPYEVLQVMDSDDRWVCPSARAAALGFAHHPPTGHTTGSVGSQYEPQCGSTDRRRGNGGARGRIGLSIAQSMPTGPVLDRPPQGLTRSCPWRTMRACSRTRCLFTAAASPRSRASTSSCTRPGSYDFNVVHYKKGRFRI